MSVYVFILEPMKRCFYIQVTTEHVNQASRLLSKSIVRVEQPDIALQDDDDAIFGDVDVSLF